MSKGTWRIVVIVAVVIGVIWWWRHRRPAPDERLAGHVADVCEIAGRYADRPSAGVDRLFAYLGDNTPAILHDEGELVVLIERIGDDAAHDARARTAAEIIHAPALACVDELTRFAHAVENDPEATAKLSRGAERLGRTLSILLGAADRGALASPSALVRWATAGATTATTAPSR